VVLIAYVLAFCIVDLVVRTKNSPKTGVAAFAETLHNPASLILSVYCLTVGGLVLSLCCFHSYLVTCGMTTRERCSIGIGNQPYPKGIKNWPEMLCPPWYPSAFNPTAYVNRLDAIVINGDAKEEDLNQL